MAIRKTDIIKFLTSAKVGLVLTDGLGVIRYCDRGFQKFLPSSKQKDALHSNLGDYFTVIYPFTGFLDFTHIRETRFQIWETKEPHPTGGNKLFIVFSIYLGENTDAVRFLHILQPYEKTSHTFLGLLDVDLTYLINVIEQLPLIVIQIDRSGKVIYANEHIRTVTGWEAKEVIGKNWFEEFFPEEIKEETLQLFRIGRKSPRWDVPPSFECEVLRRAGGKVLVQWACLTLSSMGSDHPFLLMLGQELTSQHRARFLEQGIQVFRSAIHSLSGELVKGVLEEESFHRILSSALEATKMEAGLIYKIQQNKAHLVVSEGIDEGILESIRIVDIQHPAIQKLINYPEVLEFGGMFNEEDSLFSQQIRQQGFTSILGISARSADNVYGFIILATTREERSFESQKVLLRIIGCGLTWVFQWYFIQEIQRRQVRQYELLERMLPYGLFSIGEDGIILSCNEGGKKLLGFCEYTECPSIHIAQFIPNWDTLIEPLRLGYTQTTGQPEETEIISATGEKIPVEYLIGNFTLASRSFYLVFLRDIRWRKQAIEAIRKAEERYRELFENANDIVYTHDLNGKFTSINKMGMLLTGYSLEEALNITVFDLVCPEYLDEVKERIRQKLLGAPPTKYEVEIFTKEGNRIPLEVSTRVIYEQGIPVGIQGIARDITDRKKAEEQRKRLEAQILHTQKLESLGVLAGGIAHDFNNILVGIIGNVELASAKLPADSEIQVYLRRIEESTRRFIEITNQMLAYSGQGALSQVALNISKLISEMRPLLSAVISKKAVVEYHCDPDVPCVLADPTQVHQIIMNLVSNASEALGEGPGKITISCRVAQITEEDIKQICFLEPVQPGRYVCIEVTDTGCGMSEEIMSRIFDPFFSTKFIGRGLGLPAVLGIVRAHGGTIVVQSAPGKGSTFQVYLPVKPENTPPTNVETRCEESISTMTEQPPVQKERLILVADDEELVSKVIKDVLSQFGYRYIIARTGKEAVDLFQQHHDKLYAVLLDYTMPEMDGKEAISKIYEIDSTVPVIISSGFPEEEILHKLEGKKPWGFLQKPYKPIELIKLLERIADSSRS